MKKSKIYRLIETHVNKINKSLKIKPIPDSTNKPDRDYLRFRVRKENTLNRILLKVSKIYPTYNIKLSRGNYHIWLDIYDPKSKVYITYYYIYDKKTGV